MDSSSECDSETDIALLIARIKEQQELNENLKDEANELKDQCKVLKEYKDDFNSLPDFKREDMDAGNILSSFSSIPFGCTNLIETKKSIQSAIEENDQDDVFLPTVSDGMKYSMSPCRGCGMMFRKSTASFERAYYIHCIKECPKYQALNLVKKCNGCQKLFLNAPAVGNHFCNRIIPMFEGKQIALSVTARRESNQKFKLNPCKGCGKEFKEFNGKGLHEIDYYVHCIKDCSEYRKLGLAQVCPGCNKWFINQYAISSHKCSIPRKDRTRMKNRDEKVFKGKLVTRPKWMSRRLFEKGLSGTNIRMKPKKCPGCDIFINDGDFRKNVVSFNYLVHCIEECDEYKKLNLIRECNICKLKFLNRRSYATHLGEHKINKKH